MPAKKLFDGISEDDFIDGFMGAHNYDEVIEDQAGDLDLEEAVAADLGMADFGGPAAERIATVSEEELQGQLTPEPIEFELKKELAWLRAENRALQAGLETAKAVEVQPVFATDAPPAGTFPHELQDSRKMLVRMAVVSGHQSGYQVCPNGYKAARLTRLAPDQLDKLAIGGEVPHIDFVNELRDSDRQAV